MKRFPELARRAVALALAASMSLSVLAPGAAAAAEPYAHDHVHSAAENSVDELGNVDLTDEVSEVPAEPETAAKPVVVETPEETAEPDPPPTEGDGDHQWSDWTEGVTDDGQPVKLRICEDCGAVELEDGTIIGYINMSDEPELADDDQPEWYPSDFIAPLGMDGSEYAVATQGLDADGKTWNYSADYSKWMYNTSTQYNHGYDDMGNDHHGLGLNTWTSVSNGNNKAVTCTEGGYIGHNCNISQKVTFITIVCHSEWRETIPTPGSHLKNLYEVKATCTEPGVKYYYCGRNNGVNGGNGGICYYTWDDPAPVITPATGHKTADGKVWYENDETTANVGWVTTEATCTKAGSRTRICATCGKVEADDDYAKNHPATGHKNAAGDVWYENDEATANIGWVTDTEPTCGVAGSKSRTCVTCNKTETQTIPATGNHTPGEKTTVTEAKCEVPGKWEIRCTVCNELLDSGEIPALDHAWDEGTIDQKYPCVDGTITYKCTREGCGATKTEVYKAVAEHSYGVWYDDYEYGCQTQNESRVCLVCGHKETRDSGNPSRKHKYTNYKMTTPDRSVTVPVDISSLHLSSDAITALEKIFRVKFDESKTHILITDELPTPIVRADCDYGCGAYDEINAVNYPKFAAEAFAATEASKSVAETATPLIKEALAETKAAVNNAQSREEAIAALDQIYNVARQKLLDQGSVKVTVHWEVTGTWPSNYPVIGGNKWSVPLYDGTINIPLSEEIVDPALSQLKAAIDDAKEMLNNSFLSEDAVKVAVNKIVDTVAGDDGLKDSIRELSFYPIYKSLNTRGDNWPNQATDATQTETAQLILRLADSLVKKDPNAETDAWQEFLNAIFDDLVDMLIEELKKDEDYSKYLNNKLGDQLLEELRPKLREELVNDTTFVDTIRGIASNAIENAANGVNRGWSDERVLANLRTDLLKVQDPVEQELLYLANRIGDLVGDSLTQKINALLPFGDLTSWIGKWVGDFARDKVIAEVSGETGKVRQTIDLYINYITCGAHDERTRIARSANCNETEVTETYCAKCGWVFKKEDTAPMLGHVPVDVPGYEATETTDGLTDGVRCARCGLWLDPQVVIPAKTPEYDKWYVKADITADTVKAAGYKNRQKLDETLDSALQKAGFDPANSERFLAQVQTNLDVLEDEQDRDPGQGASRILPNERYPDEGVTGTVKFPAKAPGKNGTYYAVQVLTADSHGYSAGDVVITPLTVTDEGLTFKTGVQAVVAIAWKPNN